MLFGNPLEKTVEDISQKMDELKNQRKLVELDMEKRILVLENTASSLQKLLGNIKNFEAAKDTISRIEDIQNKLRDIEDTSLIARLETVQSDDRIVLIDEGVAELKQKVALLSDAIDILSEPKANVPESNSKMNSKELVVLKADVASMKDAILRLETNTINPKTIESLEEDVAKDQASILSIENDFKSLTGTVREKIEFLERNINGQKRAEIPECLLRDIASMKKEIGQVKDVEAQIVTQIESYSRKLQELKLLQDERKDYTTLKNSMEIVQKTVSMLKKEMDLDRTMYPENIMRLEREIAGMKGAKKESATMADVQKLAGDVEALLREHKSLKEKMPKYEETIDSLIKNNDAIKSGVADTVKTVKQALSESTELKKDVQSFEKSIAGINRVQGKLDVMAKTVDLIGNELSAQKEGMSREVRGINDKLAQLESGGKHQFGNVVDKMETDIRLLRKELSVLKENPPEKSGDAAAISREITSLKKNLSETLKLSEAFASESVELKSRIKNLEKSPASASHPGKDGFAGTAIESLEKEIRIIKKEMDFDRALYPENIMRLEKEVSGIKSALKSRGSEIAVPAQSNVSVDKVPDVASELKKMSDAIRALSEEKEALKNELAEFRSLAESLIAGNQQLAEGLNEARLEIDEMRQKQPIIID